MNIGDPLVNDTFCVVGKRPTVEQARNMPDMRQTPAAALV